MDYGTCHGNGDKHCCWFKGVLCPYLEEYTVDGRRWACGLLRERGTWDKVLKDPRYKGAVQALFDTVPELAGMNCRDWPQEYDLQSGRCCYEE